MHAAKNVTLPRIQMVRGRWHPRAASKFVFVPFGLDRLGNETFPRGDDRRLRAGGFQSLADRPEMTCG
jgi:hypothetical protein